MNPGKVSIARSLRTCGLRSLRPYVGASWNLKRLYLALRCSALHSRRSKRSRPRPLQKELIQVTIDAEAPISTSETLPLD